MEGRQSPWALYLVDKGAIDRLLLMSGFFPVNPDDVSLTDKTINDAIRLHDKASEIDVSHCKAGIKDKLNSGYYPIAFAMG